MSINRSASKLFIAIAIGLVGFVAQLGVVAKTQAVLATTTAPPSAVPQSQEVVDEEFRRIVRNLDKARPLTSTSQAGVSVAGRSALSAGAQKLLKGGGGIGFVATFLYFADSTGVGRGEISKPGAAKLELQIPRKNTSAKPNNSRWSTKHSHKKEDLQIYVRVNTVTGTRANPKVTRGMPGTSTGPGGYITLSSKNRANDHGCGRTGNGSNRWKDSSRQPNSAGWAYFPDCSRNTQYQVKLVDLPTEYKDAKVYSSTRTVSDISGKIVIEEHEVTVFNLPKVTQEQKIGTATAPQPSREATNERECIETQREMNSRPVTGSGGLYGGDIGYGGGVNAFNAPNVTSESYRPHLNDIFSVASSSDGGNIIGSKCKKLSESRNIVVHIKGTVLPENTTRSLKGIEVTIYGKIKCSTKVARTNSRGIAVFKGCTRGQASIALSDKKSLGRYYTFKAVPGYGSKNGAKITGNSSRAGSSAKVEIQLLKAFSNDKLNSMEKAARVYWTNKQKEDLVVLHRTNTPVSRTCKKTYTVAATHMKDPHDGNAALAHAAGLNSAAYGVCAIYYNLEADPGLSGANFKKYETACGVHVHEYGHVLGYKHVDDRGDIMYPTANDADLARLAGGINCSSRADSNAARVLPAAALIPFVTPGGAKDKCGEAKLRQTFMVEGLEYRGKPEEEDMLEACARGYRYGDYRAKEAIKQRKSYSAATITVSQDNPKSCMLIDQSAYPKKYRACKKAEAAARADRYNSKSYVYPKKATLKTTISSAKAKGWCTGFIGVHYRANDKPAAKEAILNACQKGFRDGYHDAKIIKETGNSARYDSKDFCAKQGYRSIRNRAACEDARPRAIKYVEDGRIK